MSIDKQFGELIEHARKARSWSQQRLADELGMSQVSVHRIENGEQSLSLSRAFEIAELLEIPIEKIKQITLGERLKNLIETHPEELQVHIRKLIEENP